jgi:hypothetical protein
MPKEAWSSLISQHGHGRGIGEMKSDLLLCVHSYSKDRTVQTSELQGSQTSDLFSLLKALTQQLPGSTVEEKKRKEK